MITFLLFCILIAVCPALIIIGYVLIQVVYYLIIAAFMVCAIVGVVVYFPKLTISVCLIYGMFKYLENKWRGVRESNSRAVE